jgi:hypothetical protein
MRNVILAWELSVLVNVMVVFVMEFDRREAEPWKQYSWCQMYSKASKSATMKMQYPLAKVNCMH